MTAVNVPLNCLGDTFEKSLRRQSAKLYNIGKDKPGFIIAPVPVNRDDLLVDLAVGFANFLGAFCLGACQPARTRPMQKHVDSREVTVKLLE